MSNQPPQPEELQESKEKGHEVRDANIPHVLMYGFGMLVLVLIAGGVISGVVYKYMGRFVEEQPPATPQFQAGQSQLPPLPRLEIQGWRDMNEFRAAEEKQLDSYGWVDQKQNVVHIPIARAMEITAQKGLPQKPPGAGPSVQPPAGQGIGVAPAPRGSAGAEARMGTPGQRDNPAKSGETKSPGIPK